MAAARAERGLSLRQVSERAMAKTGYRIDDSNLAKLERGKLRYPGLEARLALTAVLGLTDKQMFAPCKTCGEDWTAACMDHPAGEQPSTEAA